MKQYISKNFSLFIFGGGKKRTTNLGPGPDLGPEFLPWAPMGPGPGPGLSWSQNFCFRPDVLSIMKVLQTEILAMSPTSPFLNSILYGFRLDRKTDKRIRSLYSVFWNTFTGLLIVWFHDKIIRKKSRI